MPGTDPRILSRRGKLVSRFTGRAHEHEGKLIELIVLFSRRWDLPIALYPSAPPQYISGVNQLPTP
jgi:hypothetical protein